MKLTYASSYALHAVAHLARQKDDGPIPSHVIAEERGIPERFLLKVLKPLVSARVLASVKGPHGGYRLVKRPEETSLLEIVEAVDGHLHGETSFAPTGTPVFNTRVERAFQSAAEAVREDLGKLRVSDLLDKEGRKGKGPARRDGKRRLG